ncbi:hypothetical protein SOVF_045810 [Spinacia oleracea]|nr:hypothetical protein SOVF_045810 [Spinacia oleracea]
MQPCLKGDLFWNQQEAEDDDDETIEDETIDDDTIEDEDEDEDDETIEDDNSKEASSSVDNNVRRRRTLVDLRHKDGRSYNVECCQGYGKSCWGSAHGWIVTHGLDDNMYLFNPLTKEQLNLPPRHTYEYGPYKRTCPPDFLRAYFITKAVLLKVPISGGLLVVALHSDGCGVVIAKPGDTHWTEISIPIQGLKMSRRITDVLYLANQGRILLLNQYGDLAYFDLEDVQKQVRWYDCELSYINQLRHPYGYDFVDHTTYIVNSGKDLLMVLRILDVVKNYADMVRDDDGHDIDQYKTVNFKVYKFHFQDKTWEELEDLLDVALFVGNNASMSVRATDAGCDHNCIYFTDDQRYYYAETKAGLGGHDIDEIVSTSNGCGAADLLRWPLSQDVLNLPELLNSIPMRWVSPPMSALLVRSNFTPTPSSSCRQWSLLSICGSWNASEGLGAEIRDAGSSVSKTRRRSQLYGMDPCGEVRKYLYLQVPFKI